MTSLRLSPSAGKEAEWLSDNMYIVRRRRRRSLRISGMLAGLAAAMKRGAALLSAARDLVRSAWAMWTGKGRRILEGIQQKLRLSEKELMLIAPAIRLELFILSL